MRPIFRLRGFAFVPCCLFLSGLAAAGESAPYAKPVEPVPPEVHGYCYADSPTVYFSAAFSSAPVGGPGGDTHQETLRRRSNTMVAWREAFESYLKQEYGSAGLVQCAMEDSLSKAQSSRQTLLDHFRSNNASYTIKRVFVETDWAYSVSPNPS